MKKSLFVFVLLIAILNANAQKHFAVKFDNYSTEGLAMWDFIPLIKYSPQTLPKIHFPSNFVAKDTAWGEIYFKGSIKSPQNDTLIVLIGNYTTKKPIIFIDRNQNRDFADEKMLSFLGNDSTIETELQNAIVPAAKEFISIYYRPFPSQEDQKMAEMRISFPYVQIRKLELVPFPYWLSLVRKATRVSYIQVGKECKKVAIYDRNFNGIYSDSLIDNILVTDTSNHEILFSRTKGAATCKSEPLIKINKSVYEVKNIQADGSALELWKTNKKYKYLHEGDKIPNLSLQDLAGNKVSLYDFLPKNKYIIIDVWGTWCKSCIEQHNNLKKFYAKNKEEVEVVGLVALDKSENVNNYLKKEELPWRNFMATKEITNSLYISTFPSYLLLSPNKEIIDMHTIIPLFEKKILEHKQK